MVWRWRFYLIMITCGGVRIDVIYQLDISIGETSVILYMLKWNLMLHTSIDIWWLFQLKKCKQTSSFFYFLWLVVLTIWLGYSVSSTYSKLCIAVECCVANLSHWLMIFCRIMTRYCFLILDTQLFIKCGTNHIFSMGIFLCSVFNYYYTNWETVNSRPFLGMKGWVTFSAQHTLHGCCGKIVSKRNMFKYIHHLELIKYMCVYLKRNKNIMTQ